MEITAPVNYSTVSLSAPPAKGGVLDPYIGYSGAAEGLKC